MVRRSRSPSRTPQTIFKKTLILDLDNTLVHALTRKEITESKIRALPDYCIQLPKTKNDPSEEFCIFERPHVHRFIRESCSKFDNIIVWSAGSGDYVEPTVKKLFQRCGSKIKRIISADTFDMIEKDLDNLIAEDPTVSKDMMWFMDDIPHRIKNLPSDRIIVVPEFDVIKHGVHDEFFKRFSWN